MSFDINWSAFTEEFAEETRQKANQMFTQVEIPSILKNLRIEKLNLGSTAPLVELTDFSTPEVESLVTKETPKVSLDQLSEQSSKSNTSLLSKTSSRSHLLRKNQGPSLMVQAVLGGNKLLPPQKQIKIKPITKVRRVYPPCHIHSSPDSQGVKKVMSSNLESDDFTEKELFESLNSQEKFTVQNGKDFLSEGMCLKIHFAYDGNASLTFAADVSLDLPDVQNFVSFPITIAISHLVIEGDLVIEFKDKVVKVYLEKDVNGPLRDFAFTVHFGDEHDYVYVDKHQIGSFLKHVLQVLIEKMVMHPNFQSVDLSKHLDEMNKPK